MTAATVSAATANPLVASRFNFNVPTPDGPLLFNARTGAVLALEGDDGQRLALLLVETPSSADIGLGSMLPSAALADLGAGGFLVPWGFDELEAIRRRYWAARRETPVVLTLTTTMDCNLGCYYCYEERSTDSLSVADVQAVVALAAERLRGRHALHVDWYGGEPLLNVAFIEAASDALQSFCRSRRIRYSASVISNGTSWPDDVGAFVKRHAINQVQVSFDGLRANHDRRRKFRDGRGSPGDSSFDRAVKLVDALVHCVRVDVRFNIDRGNQGDLLPFLRFAENRGWFDTGGATFQPARLSSYSERSSFMRRSELTVAEYDALRARVREAARGRLSVEESEAPDGFPHPRTSVCAALANGSVVVGADRRLYRCGLQVSEPARSVGNIADRPRGRSLPVLQGGDAAWWESFDPTCQPRCTQCSFLPVCWGGCPKKHLEGDIHALREQGAYWRRNLARLVAEGVGRPVTTGFEYSERVQFRNGPPDAATAVGAAPQVLSQ